MTTEITTTFVHEGKTYTATANVAEISGRCSRAPKYRIETLTVTTARGLIVTPTPPSKFYKAAASAIGLMLEQKRSQS